MQLRSCRRAAALLNVLLFFCAVPLRVSAKQVNADPKGRASLLQRGRRAGASKASPLDLGPPGTSSLDPPSMTDMSGGDGKEYLNRALGVVADLVHTPGYTHTWVEKISASTCERACMKCVINKPEEEECACFVNCREGPDEALCNAASGDGWSNDAVTRPAQDWQAACGFGDKNCTAECLVQHFVETLEGCKTANRPLDCESDVKALYAPMVDLPVGSHMYCTHRLMVSCDTFITVPTSGTIKWECFKTNSDCMASMFPEIYASDPRLETSVW
eukprot:CAMPEP_0183513722 /NCGR_PEP_ID=MMETSP0371-20130417/12391_1 /TAXON_ID=268820 /ORGANISM="Peridinium aciculiferum, Strain PAER-2" /LENGTH=273 /DNA_ID=CAMNT_0025710999 /DNA_START=57 /DNA_END=875 /DNA_ORIENTATION=-